MKIVSLKNACATASFLIAVGHTNITLAHTQVGALGSGAGATDLYTVTCSTDSGGATFRLSMRVSDDTAGSGKVGVQTRRGNIATNSTDQTGGDGAYSPIVYNNGGDGAYNVLVDKPRSGTNNYTLQFHCETSTGVHTGTSVVTNQNQ